MIAGEELSQTAFNTKGVSFLLNEKRNIIFIKVLIFTHLIHRSTPAKAPTQKPTTSFRYWKCRRFNKKTLLHHKNSHLHR